jgi:mono/diheme cytochrome c family protein
MSRGSAIRRHLLAAVLTGGALILAGGCRIPQKMAQEPKYDPLEASDFFPDGMAARPIVAGTVPRGGVKADTFFYQGKVGGKVVDGFPFPVTAEVLQRGQERFNIYCSMCHGRAGYGDGMIPARGYRRPPSYHTALLRSQPTGHFFDVMTNGFGAMPQYGTMIPAHDRWAIVAYIRALQASQNATMADVPADKQSQLQAGATTR